MDAEPSNDPDTIEARYRGLAIRTWLKDNWSQGYGFPLPHPNASRAACVLRYRLYYNQLLRDAIQQSIDLFGADMIDDIANATSYENRPIHVLRVYCDLAGLDAHGQAWNLALRLYCRDLGLVVDRVPGHNPPLQEQAHARAQGKQAAGSRDSEPLPDQPVDHGPVPDMVQDNAVQAAGPATALVHRPNAWPRIQRFGLLLVLIILCLLVLWKLLPYVPATLAAMAVKVVLQVWGVMKAVWSWLPAWITTLPKSVCLWLYNSTEIARLRFREELCTWLCTKKACRLVDAA